VIYYLSKKSFHLSTELVRILEERTVSGVGIKDQARIWQMLRKDVRVNRGDHHIIDPIEDERRLLDFLQPAVALALFLLSPRLDGDRLSLGDGGTGLRISIVLALTLPTIRPRRTVISPTGWLTL